MFASSGVFQPLRRLQVRQAVTRFSHESSPPREGSSSAPEADVEPGFVQIFVNVGKREGLSSGDLQRLLTDKGISEAEAGRIRVRDRMSFITVKKEAFERAVAALTGETVGGRTVVAELARGRG